MSRTLILNIFYVVMSAAATFAADSIFREISKIEAIFELHAGWKLTLAYLTAGIAFVLFILLSRLVVSIKPARNYIAPEARLEGVWVQTVSREERPKSVVIIRFNWLRYEWIYRGWSVPDDPDGIPPAEWSSDNFVHRAGKFYFDARARVRRDDPTDPVRSANVVGVLTKTAPKRDDSLTGNAVDFELPRGEEVFEILQMTRVSTDIHDVDRANEDARYRYQLARGEDKGPSGVLAA